MVVLCQPGAWSERQVPIADIVLEAWRQLPGAPKQVIWIAGRDYDALRTRMSRHTDVLVLREDWTIERLMVASDVLITKVIVLPSMRQQRWAFRQSQSLTE